MLREFIIETFGRKCLEVFCSTSIFTLFVRPQLATLLVRRRAHRYFYPAVRTRPRSRKRGSARARSAQTSGGIIRQSTPLLTNDENFSSGILVQRRPGRGSEDTTFQHDDVLNLRNRIFFFMSQRHEPTTSLVAALAHFLTAVLNFCQGHSHCDHMACASGTLTVV